MKLYFYLLCFLLAIKPSQSFLEQLAHQSNANKIALGVAALIPLFNGAYTQYHLKYKHNNKNKCTFYDGHHLQNIPYINILFYLNDAIITTLKNLFPQYKDKYICLLSKPGAVTRCRFRYSNKNTTETVLTCHSYSNKDIIFHYLNILSYLFLIGELIYIKHQS